MLYNVWRGIVLALFFVHLFLAVWLCYKLHEDLTWWYDIKTLPWRVFTGGVADFFEFCINCIGWLGVFLVMYAPLLYCQLEEDNDRAKKRDEFAAGMAEGAKIERAAQAVREERNRRTPQ